MRAKEAFLGAKQLPSTPAGEAFLDARRGIANLDARRGIILSRPPKKHPAQVYIWTRLEEDPWSATIMHAFEEPVWRVNWSVAGCILATSVGDAGVTLWKEDVYNKWHVLGSKAEPNPSEKPSAALPSTDI